MGKNTRNEAKEHIVKVLRLIKVLESRIDFLKDVVGFTQVVYDIKGSELTALYNEVLEEG